MSIIKTGQMDAPKPTHKANETRKGGGAQIHTPATRTKTSSDPALRRGKANIITPSPYKGK